MRYSKYLLCFTLLTSFVLLAGCGSEPNWRIRSTKETEVMWVTYSHDIKNCEVALRAACREGIKQTRGEVQVDETQLIEQSWTDDDGSARYFVWCR